MISSFEWSTYSDGMAREVLESTANCWKGRESAMATSRYLDIEVDKNSNGINKGPILGANRWRVISFDAETSEGWAVASAGEKGARRERNSWEPGKTSSKRRNRTVLDRRHDHWYRGACCFELRRCQICPGRRMRSVRCKVDTRVEQKWIEKLTEPSSPWIIR